MGLAFFEEGEAGLGCPPRADIEQPLLKAVAEVCFVVVLFAEVVKRRKSPTQDFPHASLA